MAQMREPKVGKRVKRLSSPDLTRLSMMLGKPPVLLTGACNCVICLAQAIKDRLRITKPFPCPEEALVAKYRRHLSREKWLAAGRSELVQGRPLKPLIEVAEEIIVDAYKGSKLKHYLKGLDAVKKGSVLKERPKVGFWSKKKNPDEERICVSAFVKDEPETPLVNMEKKGVLRRSRAINPVVIFCSEFPSGNLVPLAFEGAAFKILYKAKACIKNPNGTKKYVSGLRLRDQAAIFIRLRGKGRRWIKLDASSFDGSCFILAEVGRETSFRLVEPYYREDPHWHIVKACFEAQQDIYIQARGLRARHQQIRLSGTAGTSAENQFCYVALWNTICDVIDKDSERLSLFCAGDDTAAEVKEEWFEEEDGLDSITEKYGVTGCRTRMEAAWKLAGKLGVDMTEEGMVEDALDIEFCRMKIVRFSEEEGTMVKHPSAVLDKLVTLTKYAGNIAKAAAYMQEVCTGYLAAWAEVPVIGALAYHLRRMWASCSDGTEMRSEVMADHYLLREAVDWRDVDFLPEPTQFARESFERVFGVGISTQLSIEREVASDRFLDSLRNAVLGGGEVVVSFRFEA
jgi:hypothetical protein